MNKKIDIEQSEWVKFATLFKCAQEQSTVLIGRTKQDVKVVFGRWFREGNRLLDLIEKAEGTNLDNYETLTDIIHDALSKVDKIVTDSINE